MYAYLCGSQCIYICTETHRSRCRDVDPQTDTYVYRHECRHICKGLSSSHKLQTRKKKKIYFPIQHATQHYQI